MTDGDAPVDDGALLNALYPSGGRYAAPHERGDATDVGALMEALGLTIDQRLEVLKILNLQAIEGHLAAMARRSQLILEQIVASQATRS